MKIGRIMKTVFMIDFLAGFLIAIKANFPFKKNYKLSF